MVKVSYDTTEFIIKVSVYPIDRWMLLECLRGMGGGIRWKRGHGESGGGSIQLDEMEWASAFQMKRDEQGMVKEDGVKKRRNDEAMRDAVKQNMKRRTS